MNKLDIDDLLQLVRKFWWIVILSSLFFAICGFAVSTLMPSKYTSNAMILVNQKGKKNGVTYSDRFDVQQANLQMVTTYKDIISSDTVLDEAAKRIGIGEDQLSNITVTANQQSQVFTITLTAYSPKMAKLETETVAKVFKEKVKAILNANNVHIISHVHDGTKVWPNTKLFVLCGAAGGLVLSIAIILLRAIFSQKVDENYLESLGFSNLGTITRLKRKRASR